MDEYDPHNHRASVTGVVSAWMAAVIVVLVTVVTVTLAAPANIPTHVLAAAAAAH